MKPFRRLAKRIVWSLDGGTFLVVHLMVAGRFHWRRAGTAPTRRADLAAFHFDHGTVIVSEASSKKRASLHIVHGTSALGSLDPGGLEPLSCAAPAFVAALTRSNHTLKRALTDPRLISGIRNAYSDEILHAARLSPFRQTKHLCADEWKRLHAATQRVLEFWIDRLSFTGVFPEKVTAFHTDMAVHAWSSRRSVPGLCCAGAAGRVRRERDELLPALPDRWQGVA